MKHLSKDSLTIEYDCLLIDTDEALEPLLENKLVKSLEQNYVKLNKSISILDFVKLPGCAELIHKGWVLFI
jgi:hypothetical protein